VTQAFVLAVMPGADLPDDGVEIVEAMRIAWEKRLAEDTGGLMVADTRTRTEPCR
jgi:hypothetical protein